ncbi:MAG: VOC family protein [Gammaproteobacteria bacterium]|nr:VOC family protein [Gammaproteobacteria bacterium]
MVIEHVIAIYVADLKRSKAFYQDLLELVVTFDSDWCVQMSSVQHPALKLTLQPRNHELIPEAYRHTPQGFSIAFVVDDVDRLYQRARSMNLRIIKAPTNEMYGQRRFLTLDPDGGLVDVSSPCEPSPEFIARYMS